MNALPAEMIKRDTSSHWFPEIRLITRNYKVTNPRVTFGQGKHVNKRASRFTVAVANNCHGMLIHNLINSFFGPNRH